MNIRLLAAALLLCSAALAAQQPRPQSPDDPPTFGPRRPTIPPEIQWPSPPLGDGPFNFLSAEHWRIQVAVVTKGLSHPWGMAFLPGGDMLISERPGRIRLVRNGRLEPKPALAVTVVTQGLSGLLDVAVHPRFAENRFVYFTYHKPAEKTRNLVLARGTWDGAAITGVRDIFVAKGENSASRLVFGPDGMLYMTSGGGQAQDPMNYGGKIFRLKDDGTAPPDNPFAGRAGYLPEIYSLGHRNLHGLAVNPWTHEIWEAEQGPNGGDEINIIKAGANYGWPLVSLGRTYNGPRVSEQPALTGTEQPIVSWIPSIAVSGLTFYTGDRFPAWKRNAFVGGLREGEVARSGHVQRIVFNEQWEEIRREPLLRGLQQRIRDVREGPDGYLYVLTDEDNGALLRIQPAPEPLTLSNR